jgi:hypothetical protein
VRVGDSARGRHRDDLDIWAVHQPGNDFEAIEPGQLDVGDHEVGPMPVVKLKGDDTIRGRHTAWPRSSIKEGQHFAQVLVILAEEHLGHVDLY